MMCAKRTEIDRLGFFIRLSLLSLFVLAKPPVGFASEPEPSPRVSFEEFWNACSEAGCSIYPFEPKDWESRGENPRPPHADACDPYTYNAIGLPPSLSGLPDFVALVGGEKKNFFIPITKDPEQVLEKGDILIYFKSTNPESKSLYEHVTKNRWHAAIIGEDSSGLFRLDSPSEMSGRNLRNGRYHIIRLRKYPPEIKTLSQLREWQADPEKMKILEEWEKRRQERLAEVNHMIQAMQRAGFGYDGARVTEVTKPNADLAKLKEELLAGRCPKLYCSELPAMAYALAGVKLPRASSLIDSINRLDERVIEPKLKALREEGKSEAELQAARAKMIDEGLRELFNDSTVLREFGASDAEMNAFRRDGSLPASIQPIMNQYRLVLSTPRFLRMRLAQGFEAVYGGDKGVMIGPSDFFDTITDPKTEFSYVGSYVGFAYASRGQRGNAQMGAETAGGGRSFQSLLASEPKSLWSEKLHQQRVNSVRFSPDGKKVVTASVDGTAKILDLETGEEKTIQHRDYVESASFSPDGKKVVTASYDGTAKILDLETGEEKRIQHGDNVYSASFSSDGKKVVTGSDYNIATILDLETGEEKTIRHVDDVISASFSLDGKKVVTTSSDRTAKILDLETGEEKRIQHGGHVISASFSPDGKKVVTASLDDTAKILDLETGEEKRIQHRGWVNSASFSPDGKKVVTGSSDGTAKILDLETGEEKRIQHGSDVDSASFSPDGKKVVTASLDRTAKILDLVTGEEKTIRHGSWVHSASFSPDGRWVATVDNSGGFHLFGHDDVDQSFFEKRLREYNEDGFLGDEGFHRAQLRQMELKMAFKKAKGLNQMDRQQAEKLMNDIIRRADYRGFIRADERASSGPEAHIWGVINSVWPPTTNPAPTQAASQ